MYYAFPVIALITIVLGPLPSAAGQLGRYRCQVEDVYGIDELATLWKNADLLYDADAGTLHGSFDPSGNLEKNRLRVPPGLLFSRLKVETPPSKVNNLQAVQYDPATNAVFKPVVAWLMLETLDSTLTPRFQFFSNMIRGIAVGGCVRQV